MRSDDARLSKCETQRGQAEFCGTREQIHRTSILFIAICVAAICDIVLFVTSICTVAIHIISFRVIAIRVAAICVRDGVRGRGGFVGLCGESEAAGESVSLDGREKRTSARA